MNCTNPLIANITLAKMNNASSFACKKLSNGIADTAPILAKLANNGNPQQNKCDNIANNDSEFDMLDSRFIPSIYREESQLQVFYSL